MGLNYLDCLREDMQDGFWHIKVLGTVAPKHCLFCSSKSINSHGSLSQKLMDIPVKNMPTVLFLERKRFRCGDCGKTFLETLPDIDKHHNMTSRLVKYIEQESLQKTFSDVAYEVGVDAKTVKNIYKSFSDASLNNFEFDRPKALAIGSLKVAGKCRAVLTNAESCRLIDVFPTCKKDELIAYFDRVPYKASIEVVLIDMCMGLKEVVQLKLPESLIIVDRSQVEHMGDITIDAIRKSIRPSLSSKQRLSVDEERLLLMSRISSLNSYDASRLRDLFTKRPILAEAYYTKELLMQIYEQDSKEVAQEVISSIATGMSPELRPWFKEIIKALEDWQEEILAWYGYNSSSLTSYTRCINDVANQIDLMRRGYSFDVIRTRLLLNARADR